MQSGTDVEPDLDIDLAALGEEFVRDPYPVYERLRQRGSVHRARLPDGTVVWLVVGYDEVRAALADSRLSKAWRNVTPDQPVQPVTTGENMLRSDAPQHTRLRGLVSRAFTPRRVASLAPRIQQITQQLLETMRAGDGQRADLVKALSFPLPITVISELLGVPFLAREPFRAWSELLVVAEATPETRQAAAEMGACLRELVETKRRAPGDDMLSDLIAVSDEDGDRLSEDELLGMAQLLLIAGFETTVNLISNGVLALLTHPDQCALLRATPSLMDSAVEEMLRYEGPLESATFRFTLDPIEIGGRLVPGGGEIVLPVIADAGRDPGRFDAPGRFDITRDARGHMAFRHGSHYCIGAPWPAWKPASPSARSWTGSRFLNSTPTRDPWSGATGCSCAAPVPCPSGGGDPAVQAGRAGVQDGARLAGATPPCATRSCGASPASARPVIDARAVSLH